MGALLTKFRGKKLAIEAAPDGKEDSETATGDVPSTQELPSKAAENEKPVSTDSVKLEETGDKPNEQIFAEPTVTEFERLRETKLEKEKTIKDTGETTEKTVFTEVQESVKIEETKGPIADPISSKKEKKSLFPSFSKDSLSFASEATVSRPTSMVSQTSSEFFHPVIKEEGPSEAPLPPQRGLFRQTPDEKKASFTASITKSAKDIQSKTENAVAEVSAEVKNKAKEAEESARELQSQADETAANLKNEVESKAKEAEKTVADTSADLQKKAQDAVSDVQSKAQSIADKTNAELQSKASEAKAGLEQAQSKAYQSVTSAQSLLQNKAQEAESKLKQTQAQAEKSVTDTTAMLQSKAKEAENKIQSNIKSVESAAEAKAKEAEAKAKEMQEKAEKAVADAAAAAEAKAKEAEAKAKDLQSKTEKALADAAAAAEAKAKEAEAKAKEIQEKAEKAAADAAAAAEAKAKEAEAALQDLHSKADKKLADATSQAEAALTNVTNQVEAKTKEVEGKIQNVQAKAESAVSNASAELKKTAEDAESQVISQVKDVESKVSSATDEFQNKKNELEENIKNTENQLKDSVKKTEHDIETKGMDALQNLPQVFPMMGALGALAGGGKNSSGAPDMFSGVTTKTQEIITTVQGVPVQIQRTISEVTTKAQDVVSELSQIPTAAMGALTQVQGSALNTANQGVQGIQSKAEESILQVVDDGTAGINDAVVKIQAGVRGYLTRKSLKEKKEKTEPASENGGPTNSSGDLLGADESSILDESLLSTEEALVELLQDDLKNSQLTEEELDWLKEGTDEEQAATRIQAAFRGYMVRKDQQPSK